MPSYNVFYTDKPLSAGDMPDFSFILPLVFVTKEDALNKAFKLIHSGAVVWKIEGAEGFYADRTEIEKQYRVFKAT